MENFIDCKDHLVKKEGKWGPRVAYVWCGINISLLFCFFLRLII